MDQDVPLNTLHPQVGDDPIPLASNGGQPHNNSNNNHDNHNDNNSCNSSDLNGEDDIEDTIESDTMVETSPHSMLFEASTADTIATLASLSAQADLGFTEMPTRDWIKMQSKIQALETEVFHISRTNRLLNDELDKLTGILARLTASDDEFKHLDKEQRQVEEGSSSSSNSGQPGWRREYEFLVQQVDLMHRQLQAAQLELGGRTTPQGRARVEEMEVTRSTQVTRQLHAEIKELTASLKMWQSALQQTDSQYRRKCDDERALKQTLRERESELSSLVEKLEQSRSHSASSGGNGKDLMSNTGLRRNDRGMPGTFPEALSAEASKAKAKGNTAVVSSGSASHATEVKADKNIVSSHPTPSTPSAATAAATAAPSTPSSKVKTQTAKSSTTTDPAPLPPIEYVRYESEHQLSGMMSLIENDLSEPYSIYTYRYFLHQWPKLSFLAMDKVKEVCIGVVVCRLEPHGRSKRNRGYIAMLAVSKEYRKRKIGSTLVLMAIEAMKTAGADEIVLETEYTNQSAIALYQQMGFIKDKRLYRYYLNGIDAFRLKLFCRPQADTIMDMDLTSQQEAA
ncbi:hypothetical protein EC968_008768 [Mortierella alpina]|nr:hypothetical protein EC968_008768 [Mortierella alpina]